MIYLKDRNKDELVEGHLNPNWIVEKSDPLMLMQSVPFTLGELKLLDTYISRINAADPDHRTVVFTKKEYEQLMGISCANPRSLDRSTDDLLRKIVKLKMPGGYFLKFTLFNAAGYLKDDYGNPIVELTCSEQARELFFFIKKDGNTYQYFKYALENVIKLTRKTSYLLYLHIIHERYRGEWEISVDELRDIVLDCKGQESYKEYKIFKNRILDPAVKEVNKKTDCHFEYEPIKSGRWVVRIKFIYHSQEQLEGQTSLLSETSSAAPSETRQSEDDTLPKYSNSHIDFLAEAVNREFDEAELLVLSDLANTKDLSKYNTLNNPQITKYNYLSTMYNRLNMYSKKRKIKDRFAYLRKMIEDDGE